MKLWPTKVNLIKVMLCAFLSSSLAKRYSKYLEITASSTSYAFIDMM
jgi:hypothetical protein